MKTKRYRMGDEVARVVPKASGDCQVHDLPTDGLARRVIRRARAPGGVNLCSECAIRAKQDADAERRRPAEES